VGSEGVVQGTLKMFVDFHDGCLISTSVAVVWRGEDGHDILILRPIVSLSSAISGEYYLHDKLMSSRDQGESVVVIECF
jgi:hypothetical protein